MAVKNLELPIFHYTNPNTNTPASGWLVNVYAAGTTNRITTWQDSGQSTANSNPVVLDTYGNAKIWFAQTAKIVVTDASGDGTYGFTMDNISPSGGTTTVTGNYNLVLNGSFESSESDSTPTNWTVTPYDATVPIEVITTDANHGTSCLKFEGQTGFGGGTATSAKFDVTSDTLLHVALDTYASNATTTNDVQVFWYQYDDTASAVTTSVDLGLPSEASGNYPTSWTHYSFATPVPSDATRAEIKITGIDSGGSNLDAIVYFDNVFALDNQSLVSAGNVSSPVTFIKAATGATGVNPSIASEGEADTGLEIKDSNGNEIIIAESVASAVNEVTVTNAATGNGPTIEASGETNVDLNVKSKGSGNIILNSGTGSVKTDSITAETTNGDLNLARNGTGDITVDSVPIYGLVVLDEPVSLVSVPSDSSGWVTLDMSAVYSAAATAGATKAILKVAAQTYNSSGNTTVTGYIRKTGSAAASSDPTRVCNITYQGASATYQDSAIETLVNLDGNSDFDYKFEVSASLTISVLKIHLVGYYV